MSADDFDRWVNSEQGLSSIDPCNILKLSKTLVGGEEIDFYNKMETCINKLVYLNRNPITTYRGKAIWVDTFFEKTIGKTLYDDIMQQVFGSGENITKHYWFGSRLPTNAEIEKINKDYP